MLSGSQAMSVRIENTPTSVHSPGTGGLGAVSPATAPAAVSGVPDPVLPDPAPADPLSPGSTITVSPGGATPLSEGQLQTRLG